MSDEGRNAPGQELQDYLDSLLGNPSMREQYGAQEPTRASPPGGDRTAALTRASAVAESRERAVKRAAAQPPVRSLPEFADPPRPLKLTLPPPPPVPAPLAETAETPPPAPAKPALKPTAARPAPTKLESTAAPPAPAKPEPAPTIPVTPPDADADAEAAAPISQPATTEWLANGRPSWAQRPFEALLFKVGGLALAVPLVELGTIYPMSAELTPLFGQANWFIGLLPIKGVNIRTVDSARIVMPERYDPAMQARYRYVISISGVDWGLAVDNVDNAITLDPDQVRWRGERSKRPWLAGTVVEHMCALLDVSQLARMFYEQDHRAIP